MFQPLLAKQIETDGRRSREQQRTAPSAYKFSILDIGVLELTIMNT